MTFDYLWAKYDSDNNFRWHPLILHMIDAAAVADIILSREPLIRDWISCEAV